MKLKLGLALMLVAVGGGAVAVGLGGLPGGPSSSTRFLTTVASLGEVRDEVAATGAIAPVDTYLLDFGVTPTRASGSATGSAAAGSSGTWPVTRVDVAVGDRVTAGQALATADPTSLEADLAAAVNQYRVAGYQLVIANDQLASAASGNPERQAKIAVWNAQNAKVDAARRRDELEAQIALATITAPVDGVVTAVAIVPGFDAPSGTAITLDDARLQVTASVVEGDLDRIRVGQDAEVLVGAVGATVAGRVTAIAPVASSAGSGSIVSYPVTVELIDPPASIRSGMSADVTITIATASNALTVPSSALVGTGDQYAVRVLAADGTVATRAVTLGVVSETAAQVLDGLTEGETVITGTVSSGTTTVAPGGGFGGGFGPGGFPGGGLGGGTFGGRPRDGN